MVTHWLNKEIQFVGVLLWCHVYFLILYFRFMGNQAMRVVCLDPALDAHMFAFLTHELSLNQDHDIGL